MIISLCNFMQFKFNIDLNIYFFKRLLIFNKNKSNFLKDIFLVFESFKALNLIS